MDIDLDQQCSLDDTFNTQFSPWNQHPFAMSTPKKLPECEEDTTASAVSSSIIPSPSMSVISQQSPAVPSMSLMSTDTELPLESLFVSPTVTTCTAPDSAHAHTNWHGFKIVGDNIDKNVRRQHQTIDRTTTSLHYFNAYAVSDRVNFSSFSENRPDISFSDQLAESLLPSTADLHSLLLNFEVLIGRILVEHLPLLSKLLPAAVQHITHKYSAEMSLKSEVVSIHA